MSPALEYRIAVDEAYVRTALRRLRELKSGARRQRVTNWLVGPLFVGFGIAIVCFGGWLGGSAFVVLGALVPFGNKLDEFFALRRFRSPSFRILEVRVAIGESACRITDENSEQELDWKLFPKARAFEDGTLLYSAEEHARWLPNAALVSGTPVEVEALLSAKVADFAVVPWRKRRD